MAGMTASLAAIQAWPDIWRDVRLNWFIYLSMPLVAAFVGYATKLLALQMLYRPLEFRGIGPIGWQGIIPRRAGKMASITIQMLMEKLLRPAELLDKIDADRIVYVLREPLTTAVDDISREIIDTVRPGLWDALPELGRRSVVARIHDSAPRIIDNLLAAMKADIAAFIDLRYMAVTILVKNKAQLNKMMQTMGGGAMRFMRRTGIYFGFGIGLIQMVAWAVFRNPWIMPGFGFFVGFVSDWIALNLIFIPRRRVKLLGFIPMHAVLHKDRELITCDYAKLIATEIFSPDVVFDAIMHGPTSGRIFAAIEKEISAEIDHQSDVGRPLIALAVGSKRYLRAKESLARLVMERLPDTMWQAQAYGADAIDVENLIAEKMRQLSPDEYESILRPIFKDDEMLVVIMGAILGFLVGELQVVFVEQLAR